MLKSKSFIVVGETVHKNGEATKNIAEKVDKAINSFLSSSDGKYVDLKIDTKIEPSVGTDVAFITVVVDEPEKKGK